MSASENNEGRPDHVVLVNDEEQHSLWPAGKPAPAGWRQVCGPATKAQCLEYVRENWRDITPLSVRRSLASGT